MTREVALLIEDGCDGVELKEIFNKMRKQGIKIEYIVIIF